MAMGRAHRRRTASRAVLVMMAAGLVWGPAANAGMRQSEAQIQLKSDSYNVEQFPWQQVMQANQQGVEFQAPGPPPPVTRDKTTVKLTLQPRYGDAEDAEVRRYEAVFEATYLIRNKKEAPENQNLTKEERAVAEKTTFVIFFPFPVGADTLPEATVTVHDVTAGSPAKDVPEAVYRQEGVSFETIFLPKQTKEITVSYRAYGTEDFVFALDHNERMKQLEVQLAVPKAEHPPDLEAVNCLKPTTELTRTADGYTAQWKYTNLLTTRDIIVTVPEPFVGRNVLQRLGGLVRTGFGSAILFVLLLLAGGHGLAPAADRQPVPGRSGGHPDLRAADAAPVAADLADRGLHHRLRGGGAVSGVEPAALARAALRDRVRGDRAGHHAGPSVGGSAADQRLGAGGDGGAAAADRVRDVRVAAAGGGVRGVACRSGGGSARGDHSGRR